MFRNMAASLFRHGKIITTPAKAKEAQPFAERLITLAKRGPNDLAAKRRAIRLLHDPALVRSLFEDLGVRYRERAGGYTRILHLAKTRVGDGARQVLFELVEGGVPARKDRRVAKAAVQPAAVIQPTKEKPVSAGVETPAEAETPTPEESNAETPAGGGEAPKE
jgi:large subunit ribosomal protein L17